MGFAVGKFHAMRFIRLTQLNESFSDENIEIGIAVSDDINRNLSRLRRLFIINFLDEN